MSETYTNKQIQEKADGLLKSTFLELFNDLDLELNPFDLNTQYDRGIDWLFELVHKQHGNTTFRFNIQNKGSLNKKSFEPIKNKKHEEFGKISWQLKKIRHAKYYCLEIFDPLIIIACDLRQNKIYWHSIQLDRDIEGRIQNQEAKELKSIQIYLDPQKVLSKSTVSKFLDDVSRSRNEQSLRANNSQFQSNGLIKRSHNDIDRSKHILLQFEEMVQMFQGIQAFPSHIFPSLYPFTPNEDSRARYSEFTLYTGNKVLFDFFNSLKLINGEIVSSDNELIKEKKLSDRIYRVIRLLHHNSVLHLVLSDDTDKKVCIHKLFKESNCDCISCSYSICDFERSFTLASRNYSRKDPLEYLKQIYMFCQFGQFKRAFAAYEKAYVKFTKDQQYFWAFLCRYNQKKLFRYFARTHFKKDRNEILDKVRNISLEDELFRIKKHLHPDTYKIAVYIKEENYLNWKIWKVDGILSDIQNKYSLDRNGGWSTANQEQELMSCLSEVSAFIGGNLLISDHLGKNRNLIHKVFEGLFGLYSMKNPNSGKITNISSYVISHIIFYGKSDFIKGLISKYKVSDLKIRSTTHGVKFSPNTYLLNIIDSHLTIVGVQSKHNAPNYFFRDSINSLLRNLIVVMAVKKSEVKELNDFFQGLLCLHGKNRKLVEFCMSDIKFLLRRKGEALSISTLKMLLKLSLVNARFKTLKYLLLSNYLDKSKNQKYVLNLLAISRNKKAVIKDMENTLSLYDRFNQESKLIIKNSTIMLLSEKFHPEIYFLAVINNVLDFRTYFDDFLKTVPIWNENNAPRFFGLHADQKVDRINQLVDIAYLHNLDLGEDKFSKIPNGNLYYEWLFNLRAFDYAKFNPYWLFDYNSDIYYGEFKKIPQIKTILNKLIQDNPVPILARVYAKMY